MEIGRRASRRFSQEAGFQDFFRLVQPFFHDIEEMQHYELTDVVNWR